MRCDYAEDAENIVVTVSVCVSCMKLFSVFWYAIKVWFIPYKIILKSYFLDKAHSFFPWHQCIRPVASCIEVKSSLHWCNYVCMNFLNILYWWSSSPLFLCNRFETEVLPIVGTPFWISPECLHGLFYNEKVGYYLFNLFLWWSGKELR